MKSNLQDCKILVTGGAGFIASHLVDALVKKKAVVTVVDDLSNGKLVNVNRRQILFKPVFVTLRK